MILNFFMLDITCSIYKEYFVSIIHKYISFHSDQVLPDIISLKNSTTPLYLTLSFINTKLFSKSKINSSA